MSSRFRSRTQLAKNCYRSGTQAYCDPDYSVNSEYIWDMRVARNRSNVVHQYTVSPLNGVVVAEGNFSVGNGYEYRMTNRHDFVGDHFWYRNIPGLSNQIDSAFASMLKHKSANNEFELLPFLFDIDSTIAGWADRFGGFLTMDRHRLRKGLSYGAFEWDILPFISDCRSLVQSIKDILARGAGYPQCAPISRRRVISYFMPHNSAPSGYYGSMYISDVVGTARFSGAVFYTPPRLDKTLGKIIFLLDELGVHPDLKTAWDVLPFSFVADYFLPIGDLIESLHPRGWGSTNIRFEGFSSLHLEAKYRFSYRDWSGQKAEHAPYGVFRHYQRTWSTDTPTPQKPVVWSAPSFRQVFNTAYLAGSILTGK